MFQNTFPHKKYIICSNQIQQWIAITANDAKNERNYLDSYFPFLKTHLEAFKFIYILKLIQLMEV